MSRYLEKANIQYKEVFDACVSTYTERTEKGRKKKDRLLSYYDLNEKAILNYEKLLLADEIHTLIDMPALTKPMYTDDMISIYKDKFSKKGEPGRTYYNQILKSTKAYICPFCAHREANTLDHMYPKTIFPSLAIAPINLVPCCADCNKMKGTATPENLEDTLFHPYFDDITQDIWLEVKFNESTEFVIDYRAIKPNTWSDSRFRRLKNELKLLDLCDFYARQGMVSFSTSYGSLKGAFKRHGRNELEIVLSENLDSMEENFGINSWQAALYRSFRNSEWFCKGGFISD